MVSYSVKIVATSCLVLLLAVQAFAFRGNIRVHKSLHPETVMSAIQTSTSSLWGVPYKALATRKEGNKVVGIIPEDWHEKKPEEERHRDIFEPSANTQPEVNPVKPNVIPQPDVTPQPEVKPMTPEENPTPEENAETPEGPPQPSENTVTPQPSENTEEPAVTPQPSENPVEPSANVQPLTA